MLRTNEEIRRAIGGAGLKNWQIANAMGIREENFSRKLRTELSEEEKQKILSIIEKVANREGEC